MSTRRRTPAEIARIVSQFHASDLSRRDFANRHGFNEGSLARWLRAAPAPAASAPKFVRVIGPAPVTPPAWFELALPDGRRLRIPAGCDPTALRGVLEVLAAC
jgi:transposase-like protein